MESKVINLFGGPGSGKSTTAASLFHKMKILDKSVELVHEFAKDLTWSKRLKEITYQPYIFGEQYRRLHTLIGEVEYIVVDSPLLLSSIYGAKYPNSFHKCVFDLFNSFDNINFFINRVKGYNPVGRNQTEEESDKISEKIQKYLLDNQVEFDILDGNELAASFILLKIFKPSINS